jgi:Protein of unknown function (DUF3572)
MVNSLLLIWLRNPFRFPSDRLISADMTKPTPGDTMREEVAQTIALQALGWLATQDELFPAFLSSTGTSLDALRSRAGDPLFLAAVLDFLMQEDAWILDFASSAALSPASLQSARAALPGGDLPHWT